MTYITFPFLGKIYKIDRLLAEYLLSLVYNIKEDWDFMILIAGNRMVRVGKSVLAMTICAFLAYMLEYLKLNPEAYSFKTLFFDHKKLMDVSQKLSKYHIIHYDEGREGLAASKAMNGFQQDILDYFAECGQLNHIFVIVCPDFFELKENIAVSRSECLINVYRESHTVKEKIKVLDQEIDFKVNVFDRGYFKLYNRDAKNLLFDLKRSTSRKDYNMVSPSIAAGRFENQYPLGAEEYKKLKVEALARFKQSHEKENKKETKLRIHLEKAFGLLEKQGLKKSKIAEAVGLSGSSYALYRDRGAKLPLGDQKENTGYTEE
jgi:hypothetical protein